MISKEEFYKKFELHWIQQVKAGNQVLSEVEFAKPKWADDKLWEMLNNSLNSEQIEVLYNNAEGADMMGEDEQLTWRLTKIDAKEDGGEK